MMYRLLPSREKGQEDFLSFSFTAPTLYAIRSTREKESKREMMWKDPFLTFFMSMSESYPRQGINNLVLTRTPLAKSIPGCSLR